MQPIKSLTKERKNFITILMKEFWYLKWKVSAIWTCSVTTAQLQNCSRCLIHLLIWSRTVYYYDKDHCTSTLETNVGLDVEIWLKYCTHVKIIIYLSFFIIWRASEDETTCNTAKDEWIRFMSLHKHAKKWNASS